MMIDILLKIFDVYFCEFSSFENDEIVDLLNGDFSFELLFVVVDLSEWFVIEFFCEELEFDELVVGILEVVDEFVKLLMVDKWWVFRSKWDVFCDVVRFVDWIKKLVLV